MTQQTCSLAYRPDIDGLRAIAILVVVLFHAFPNKMPGGFIGVDIFFVISGFLISTIIFSNLEQGYLNLVEFYVRRIRRIFPALIFVLIFCQVLGWFILFPGEYAQLGKHTAASTGFIQNIILWHETGYFDHAAETKPLLHFWSLAVEEQFYIFWPLLLTFVWRRHWSFLRTIAVIATISFAVNIYLILRGQSATAFYLSFARCWELMIGGFLAYIALHRPQLIEKHKEVQSLLGFVLLFAGLLLLNKEKDFPGWWALLPTVGTFFILSAGPTSWLNNKLLVNQLMVWIGLISYPLYLWHWPLLSFLQVVQGHISSVLRLTVIGVAILLAYLTYRFIEKPVRLDKNRQKISIPLVTTMVFILVLGEINYKTNVLERKDESTEYAEYFNNDSPQFAYLVKENMFKQYRSDCDFYDLDKDMIGQATLIPRPKINKSCFTRIPSYSHSVLLWGDSHAQQLYYGLKNNLPSDWQLLLGVSSDCPANPDITAPSTTNYCDQSNWKTLQTIKTAQPDVVIVGQMDGHSISQMHHIASKLQQMGVKKIIFTGPVPQWSPNLNKIIAKNLWRNTPTRTFLGINKKIINLNNQLVTNFKETKQVIFVNLIGFFCNDQGCLTYLGNDKKLGITTFDYGHLTLIASDKLAKEVLVDKVIRH